MSYYAFRDHKQLLSMGLARLDLADWLQPDKKLAEQSTLKKALWQHQGEQVFKALPESAAAQREVADLLAHHLPAHFPELYTPADQGLWCAPMQTTHHWDRHDNPLLQASWCVQEDLCLLQAFADGYRLTAASLCAPSYWRLLDKIGKPLDLIHAPVPGYSDQLSARINRFFSHIKVEHPVWRGNWSVVSSDQLYQPGIEPSPPIKEVEQIGERCFLRCERQTLRRLPESSAVLFTIKVTLEPLSDFCQSPEILRDLKAAIDGLSKEERLYKSLHLLEPALSQWLQHQLD
ncbi:heme-dependent oxidative N-demethylase family protein [Pseudohongiella spirulinae]|uniref:DUF3445 domain-containing protein n=1 Tax=Pseudohongiella spirulinae TaxID=1249552 RepID=A0A0S2KAH2_9GAMM|nr:DUF3445 domain-containing protein [Pseudohongiella spirulinae]ALO45288.1 hypothetical protein PS2015_605 [Pseudohongiella spirulinae]